MSSRTLRCFTRIAQIEHGYCPMCRILIRVGDPYEGYITVSDAGFRVSKWHVVCPPEFWEREMDTERRITEQIGQENALQAVFLAAITLSRSKK